MTPCDSLKQKMQLGQHKSVLTCARHTYTSLGLRKGFYAGYTTTLTMNAPYAALQFATYESFKTLLAGHDTEMRQKTVFHLLAGGAGGAMAAAATNPLDVARTRLQTQSHVVYYGMIHTMKRISSEEGFRGLATGIGTRMLLHSVSSALTWVTYEYMKHVLQNDQKK
jgi:solute carrier family 25 (mitochondrial iron transporter), member 28/37